MSAALFPFMPLLLAQLLLLFSPSCNALLAQARPTMQRILLVYFIYIYICIYIWYVRIPYILVYGTCIFCIYIHPAPFVRDAIFPHCKLVHVTTVAQGTRLAGHKG